MSREELSALYKLRNDGWSPFKLTEAYLNMSESAKKIREVEPAATYLRFARDSSVVEVLDVNSNVLHRAGDVEGGFDGIAGEIMYWVDGDEFRTPNLAGVHARRAVKNNFPLTVADRTPCWIFLASSNPTWRMWFCMAKTRRCCQMSFVKRAGLARSPATRKKRNCASLSSQRLERLSRWASIMRGIRPALL